MKVRLLVGTFQHLEWDRCQWPYTLCYSVVAKPRLQRTLCLLHFNCVDWTGTGAIGHKSCYSLVPEPETYPVLYMIPRHRQQVHSKVHLAKPLTAAGCSRLCCDASAPVTDASDQLLFLSSLHRTAHPRTKLGSSHRRMNQVAKGKLGAWLHLLVSLQMLNSQPSGEMALPPLLPLLMPLFSKPFTGNPQQAPNPFLGLQVGPMFSNPALC